MNTRRRRSALLAMCAILLAGCASTRADVPGGPSPTAPRGTGMTAGMVMPDGSTMGATSGPVHHAVAGPSAAARMICSAEVRSDLATVLSLKSVPAPTARWAAHVYTCTYQLPMGRFVLSVTDSIHARAAQAFAAGLRTRLGHTHSVAGLTTTAFATPAGVVALVKDAATLQVDASRLPASFGKEHAKRGDFAYEIAADILGCWTGD